MQLPKLRGDQKNNRVSRALPNTSDLRITCSLPLSAAYLPGFVTIISFPTLWKESHRSLSSTLTVTPCALLLRLLSALPDPEPPSPLGYCGESKEEGVGGDRR